MNPSWFLFSLGVHAILLVLTCSGFLHLFVCLSGARMRGRCCTFHWIDSIKPGLLFSFLWCSPCFQRIELIRTYWTSAGSNQSFAVFLKGCKGLKQPQCRQRIPNRHGGCRVWFENSFNVHVNLLVFVVPIHAHYKAIKLAQQTRRNKRETRGFP